MRMSRLIARYSQQLDWDAPEFAPALDDRSLEDFGRLYFGNSVLDRWMAPMVTRCSLGDARETSRVLFLRTLLHEGRERHGALRAAFDELPQFVAGRLSVRYGAEVNRLAQRKRPGVRVIFREDSDTGAQKELSRQADAVVVATSPAEALRIASPLLSIGERDALSEVRFTSSIVLCCALRRPLYSQSKLVQLSRDEGSPLETVLFEPAARDGRAPEGHGIATLRATGAWSESRQGVSNEQVTQEMLSALQSFDPAAARAVDWSRLVRIDDAVPHFGVGHYRLIARLERIFDDQQARGRRVFLAGDYLMGPSREAAVASGERTARRIMAC